MQDHPLTVDTELLGALIPLNALSESLRAQLAGKAKLEHIVGGGSVFREGDTAAENVYLLRGEITLTSHDEPTGSVRAGEEGAQHPLSPNLPRIETAHAHGDATVLRIDRNLLDTCLTWSQSTSAMSGKGEGAARENELWASRLSCSGLFSRIPAANVRQIFTRLEAVPFKAGAAVVRQGEEGDYYYILQEGHCQVTRRVKGHTQDVLLAELNPGDSFGEEALIAETQRNATVRMLSDGVLKRLTKEDFVELIKNPLLHSVSRAQAKDLTREGAVWIDVRLPEEHHRNGLRGSLNLPLASLRREAGKLAKKKRYIVYCDTGRRSSAGAFLLSERGLDAFHLAGGILGTLPGPPGNGQAPTRISDTDPAVLAERRASNLTVEVAKVGRQVAEALQRKADADAAVRATDDERDRVRKRGSAIEAGNLAEIEAHLANERERFSQEAENTEKALHEAQQTRLQLESERRAAAQQAEQEWTSAQSAQATLREETDQALRRDEQRLEREYTRTCEILEGHRSTRDRAEEELEAEYKQLQTAAGEAAERLKAIDRERATAEAEVKQTQTALHEFEAAADRRRAELARQEDQLRSEAQVRLREQRLGLETRFGQALELLELARRTREEAQAERRAAEAEAKRLEAETRAAEARLRQEAAAKRQVERKRLQAQSLKIDKQLKSAREAKERAEAARLVAEARARTLHEQSPKASPEATGDKRVMAEIKRREAQVAKAREQLEQARRDQLNVEVSRHIVDETDTGRDLAEDTLRRRLRTELADWSVEEELQRADEDRQKAQVREQLKRARERVEAEREADKKATSDMFSEIQSLLGGDEKE